jgi:hypothetical protein
MFALAFLFYFMAFYLQKMYYFNPMQTLVTIYVHICYFSLSKTLCCTIKPYFVDECTETYSYCVPAAVLNIVHST